MSPKFKHPLVYVIRAAFYGATTLLLLACQESTPSADSTSPILSVTDFSGAQIALSEPAQKVVALAPHIVENIYAAGAGHTLVGVSDYSNFPAAATQLPIVAGYESTNFERILSLAPDLVVVWGSGNSDSAIQRLKELGFVVYIDEPKTLSDIAKSIRDLGVLTGSKETADSSAEQFLANLSRLRQQYTNKTKVSVFYQVWNSPLQTISGNHIINDSIELCGGENIYVDQPAVAPVISIESVLERDPAVIIASGLDATRPDWLDDWQALPELAATQGNHLYFVDPDHIQRHTPRILLGIRALCEQLENARRSAQANPISS